MGFFDFFKKKSASSGKKNAERVSEVDNLNKMMFQNLEISPPVSCVNWIFYSEMDNLLLVADMISQRPEYLSYKTELKMYRENSGRPMCEIKILAEDKFNIEKELFLNNMGHTSFEAQKDSRMTAEIKKIFQDAANQNASDIHIDTINTTTAKIVFRVQGSLTPYITTLDGVEIMRTIYTVMGSKTEATYIAGKAQDGNISDAQYLPAGIIGIRILKGGNYYGDFMVLRLQPAQKENQQIKISVEDRLGSLGYTLQQISDFKAILDKPTGITIISGVTGSGKTTTLATLLQSIRDERPEDSIMTTEDPVEIVIPGTRQCSVKLGGYEGANEGISVFASCIRMALRADPDILMVSEMRDADAADAARTGAMTGHPLLTTLHANGAWESLKRFEAMLEEKVRNPIEYLSDPSLMSGLVYQKLLRRICPYCSLSLVGNEGKISQDMMKRLVRVSALTPWGYTDVRLTNSGTDCPHCGGKGFIGRFVCAETVNLSMSMLHIYAAKGIMEAKRAWTCGVRDEMGTMQYGYTYRAVGVSKVLSGQLDPRAFESACGRIGAEEFYKGEEEDI